MDSNHRRHRQQIYSLPHLATLVTTLPWNKLIAPKSRLARRKTAFSNSVCFLSLLSDSNQRPRDYKSRALANWAKEAKSLQPLSHHLGPVLKRLQRYDLFFIHQNFSVFFLLIPCFFFKFSQLNLHCVHTEIYSLLKCVACLLHKECLSGNSYR